MSDLIHELRATTPRDSGYAETANRAADAIESLRGALLEIVSNAELGEWTLPSSFAARARAALHGSVGRASGT